MPIFSYYCDSCRTSWDELRHRSEADERGICTACEGPANRKVTAIGGYQGSMGGASTRPKNSASKGSGEPFKFKERK